MKFNSSQPNLIDIRPLTVEKFRPYGWLLSKSIRLDGSISAFSNAEMISGRNMSSIPAQGEKLKSYGSPIVIGNVR